MTPGCERFLFLADYDLALANSLVAGSDVWLNNPLRPQEASGTSGMKAVLNGGLTLSISDGWWDEMPRETGWTIPTVESEDADYRDNAESAALYDLLEHWIAPLFYPRDKNGIPQQWLEKVRHSWTTLSPLVTSTRMVRDYTDNLYRPARHQAGLIANPATAGEYAQWLGHLRTAWPGVSVSNLQVRPGHPIQLSVRVDLGVLLDEEIAVQALYGRVDAAGELINPAIVPLQPVGDGIYSATLDPDIPGDYDFTARVVPAHEMILNPAETGLVTYL